MKKSRKVVAQSMRILFGINYWSIFNDIFMLLSCRIIFIKKHEQTPIQIKPIESFFWRELQSWTAMLKLEVYIFHFVLVFRVLKNKLLTTTTNFKWITKFHFFPGFPDNWGNEMLGTLSKTTSGKGDQSLRNFESTLKSLNA